MGSDSESDGHPLDGYLARAGKRPRTEEAATDGAQQLGDARSEGSDDEGDSGSQSSHGEDDVESEGVDAEDSQGESVGTDEDDADEDAKADAGGGDALAEGKKAGTAADDNVILVSGTDAKPIADASGTAGARQPSIIIPKAPAPVSAKPVGVILIDDTAEIVRDNEVAKLLRHPRYFDDYAEVQTYRCFNCGQVGHAARDCTNQAREKPCYLCAQFGHDGRDCPNRLCFRCGQPGHKLRDCRMSSSAAVEGRPCNRCGRKECEAAGKGDYFRYEGGCTKAYQAADLRYVRCMCCGDMGHLMCKPAPKTSCVPSCYNCGRMGHYGECCPSGTRPHLLAERRGDEERAAVELLEYEMTMEREYEERRRREQQQQQVQAIQQMHQRGGMYGGGGGAGGYGMGGYNGGANMGYGGDQRRGGIGYGNGGGGGMAYGGGNGYGGGYGGGGGLGGGRNAQVEWGYEPRQDDRRGGGGGRPFSPDMYGGQRGGGQRHDDRRSKTPRW